MSDFLREKIGGKLSVVRLGLLLCVITACGVSVLVALSDRSLNDALGVVTVLLGVPFVNKVWQRDKE